MLSAECQDKNFQDKTDILNFWNTESASVLANDLGPLSSNV